MLTIDRIGDSLTLAANFYYSDRIKQIPGAVFNRDTKQWVLPFSSWRYIEHTFKNELAFKKPEWMILGNPMPDLSHLYKINNDIQCPATKIPLYDYQQYSVRFMVDRINANGFSICADDVGIGKTGTALGVMQWYSENESHDKILLIVKKTIKRQWEQEIDKFTALSQTYTVAVTGETKVKREKAYDTISKAKKGILITNYHNFLNDTASIKKIPFTIVCIDEVHSVATRTGVLNNNIQQVTHGLKGILLTGTPIMNDPENLFSIVQLVNKSYFGDWKKFKTRYIVQADGKFGIQTVGGKNLPELREKVQNMIIRRTEYEVSVSLPKTIIQKVECEMDSVQKKIIDKITAEQSDFAEQLKSLSDSIGNCLPGKEKMFESVDAQSKGLIAARQAAATDPRLFNITESNYMKKNFAGLVPQSYKGSSKSMTLIEKVQEILDSGSKVIIFSKFWTSAYLAATDIQHHCKVKAMMYTGRENQDTRDSIIWYFKNTTEYNVLIGTDAMSEGINLDVTKYMINIDQPDTAAIKTQRIGRVRRVSATYSSVIIYDLITENSKDEERLQNIKNNENLNTALINIDEAQSQALINAMKES